jgi:hypothetical protein
MGGVWLGFLPGLRRKVKKKMGKVTKKRSSKFFGREFLEVGLRPKKGRQIFLAAAPPLSKFLNTPLPAVNAYC